MCGFGRCTLDASFYPDVSSFAVVDVLICGEISAENAFVTWQFWVGWRCA